jgi:tetratricopeptide (TPR) repeat protein
VDVRTPAISGFVAYDHGQGTPTGVVVRLETREGVFVGQVWTGSSGKFEFFRLPQGVYVLLVRHTGYKPVRMLLEYFAPIAGILVDLVPEDSATPTSPGPAVSIRELNIPPKAQAEYQKALNALSQKKPAEATDHLRKAIELYPSYDEAYVQLGWVYLEQHSNGEAQQVLQKAIATNEKNAPAHALLGSIYRQENQLPRALESLQRSLGLDDNLWFAHLELGRTLLRMRKVEEAFLHISRAHQLSAGTPSVHIVMYDACILRNDYRAAIAELEEFLRLFPDNAMVARVRQQHDALLKMVGEQKP